jgi:potassium-dependent mechanosensitive channel
VPTLTDMPNGGKRIVDFHDEYRDVKVADLLLAVIVLATTVIAAKNIPGLLEMAVLQHLPFDAGARYAVATVCRYVITVAGLLFGCAVLGIGWSKVQWLVAAMGLGLGFGLQEIFANFISGLIILFERPVRVGDVVTIDSVTGVVSRIRIRATTITDGDRKELIIPNKEFITGRVLNWTLTDPVNRVVVNVAVAYGSDTQQAAAILTRLAQQHPVVLDDPPPRVSLESFGESSLNFVLRCFLPNLDNRGTVIHDLHMAIDREFREAGIEMPFPTHEVHVRSIDLPQAVLQPAVAGLAPSWQPTTGSKPSGKAA